MLRPAGLQHLTPTVEDLLDVWWLRTRKVVPKALRKGFDSLVILVAWRIWKERNARVFDNRHMVATALVQEIRSELQLWYQAGFLKLSPILGSQNGE